MNSGPAKSDDIKSTNLFILFGQADDPNSKNDCKLIIMLEKPAAITLKKGINTGSNLITNVDLAISSKHISVSINGESKIHSESACSIAISLDTKSHSLPELLEEINPTLTYLSTLVEGYDFAEVVSQANTLGTSSTAPVELSDSAVLNQTVEDAFNFMATMTPGFTDSRKRGRGEQTPTPSGFTPEEQERLNKCVIS